MLKKIWTAIDGNKTNIGLIIGSILGIGIDQQWWTWDQVDKIALGVGLFTGVSIRHAITKAEKAAKR